MTRISCPKCHGKKLYKMSTGRRRCARCKYDFIPRQLPLRLTREEWREILHLFLMEQSSNSIVEQTGFDKKRVLRALMRVRMALASDVPDIFSGTVEVDETYLGGAWKNKRKVIRDTGTREAGEPRSSRSSGYSVETVRSGQRLSIASMKIHFSR